MTYCCETTVAAFYLQAHPLEKQGKRIKSNSKAKAKKLSARPARKSEKVRKHSSKRQDAKQFCHFL